jgi:hypothetical protein
MVGKRKFRLKSSEGIKQAEDRTLEKRVSYPSTEVIAIRSVHY